MNFGHYSCLTKKMFIVIIKKKSLWSNFSGTVKKYILKLEQGFLALEEKICSAIKNVIYKINNSFFFNYSNF